jgi:PAS domain S-box-containing protein
LQIELIVSIGVRIAALLLCLELLRRKRHWSLAVLALTLALMVVQQVFRFERVPSELPGIAVSVAAALGVLYLGWMLDQSARADDSLRDSEDRFRRLVSSAREGIWVFDADARTTFANERMAELLGLAPAELQGRSLYDFVDDGDRAELAEHFRKGCDGVEKRDVRLRRKDGSELWAMMTTSPLCDRDDRFVGVLGTVADITERKKVEAEVRKSRDALERRVEERTAELVAANERLRAEVAERRKSEHALRDATDALESRVDRRTADLEAANRTLRDEIAERRRTDEALRESEERFRAAFAHAAVGMALTTLEGRFLQVNPAYCAITGYSVEELTQRDFGTITHPDDLPENLRLMKNLVSGAVPSFFIEKRYVRKDGSTVWVRNSVSTTRDSQGRPMHMVALVEDITERKRADQHLRELSGRLLRLQDEERRRLARELHDSTAQELAALGINLSLIEARSAGLDEKARQALADSRALTDQATREVRTLAYLLHPPLLDEVGLSSAIRWYVDGFTKRSGIDVSLELPDDLGRMPVDVETTVFRIVQEALTNVHRHSASPTASVRIARDATGLTLEVRDEGKGMRTVPQFRLERGIAGLGVGIAGMRERVRQLGGALDIRTSDAGTSVHVRLPLATNGAST